MKIIWRVMLIVILGAGGGCSSGGLAGKPADFIKPSIAVMKFENRAHSPGDWDLGDGTREILVDRLLRTSRYHVIERPEIAEITKELKFQQSGVTRAQDKAALGKLKNIQYLIKGTVTDFSQVIDTSAGFGKGFLGIYGEDSQAVVSIIIYVVDVESGEIINSAAIEETVHATDVDAKAKYKTITFGGSAFYRTPLGEAMNKVIDRAVVSITNTIAAKKWMPRVAAMQPDGGVLLSGGTDRGIAKGEQYTVIEEGEAVVDPQTGDTLGRQPSRVIATLRVSTVYEKYCQADIVNAGARLKVGQVCQRVAP